MIVVTGASGNLGRAIVLALLETVPARRIVASTRDAGKVADLAMRGVAIREGDYTNAESLRHAFEGAEQVLMISSNAAAQGGNPLAHHRTVIDVARECGVRRIVYTSHMGASDRSHFPPMQTHYATEEMLRESGLSWTALRNGFYASTALLMLGEGFKSGSIRAPEDGKVAWTSHADLAGGAAAILFHEGRFEGPTPPLTATEALSLAELAAIASSILDRPVGREPIADDEFRDSLVKSGMPTPLIELQMGLFRAARAGEFATVDPTLSTLLNRPPQRVEDLVKERMSG
ncbi:SDR family oxidoreductase [Singulisphaera rosea]